MINIYLNDERQQVKPGLSLQEFLHNYTHSQSHFAIALNNQFIPRPSYNSTLLSEGDRIDLIVPMQGG